MVVGSGCTSMIPYSQPASSFDEFKKTWTVTSTRWGLDSTNLGPNPSFIRAFVMPDGKVNGQVYARVRTSDLLAPQYALDVNGNRYDAKQVSAEINCPSTHSCYWDQDVIIFIDYPTIADQIEKQGDFKLRVYGRVPPEDVLVLACQFWEVTREVLKIKNIDPGSKGAQMGGSCSA